MLLENVNAMAGRISGPVVAMFSTGQDSVCMLDIMVKAFGPNRVIPVHLYYVDRLTWVDRIISHYEQRWGVSVRRHPHPDVDYLVPSAQFTRRRPVTMTMMENYLRDTYQTPWLAWGFMKTDSLQRRGQLSLKDKKGISTGSFGMDFKYRHLYPIAEWKKAHVRKYIEDHRLPLPETYEVGIRDFTTLKGEELWFIINNYPDDWARIVAKYPSLAAERLRLEMLYD
jgi:3'-phosphoadenosine 5'-phosphosulfate sulfotransferase (PAPS reductase)/FAD synthetase